MSIRVHEIAKELKLTSKEVIEKLKALKVDAKSHMSVLTDENVKALKQSAEKKPAAAKASTKTEKTEAPAEKAKAAPAPAAPVAPVVPAAPAASKEKAGDSSGASSLENVKRELLLQRTTAAKSAAQAAEAKKAASIKNYSTSATDAQKKAPVSSPSIQRFSSPEKPKVSPAPPAPEVKAAPVRPAAPIHTAPSFQTRPVSGFTAPASAPAEVAKPTKKVTIGATIVVKELAEKLFAKPSDVIARLIKLKIFASINQAVHFEAAAKVAVEFGYEAEKFEKPTTADTISQERAVQKNSANLISRAPIVTFMGHVDHGKTSLLDAIRKTRVAAGEAGGITQHIGAYQVFLPKGAVTFLDTPGHEAFTAMRARGASATDVVVLVVAADDGVMPQTIEAIDHAKAANVPIIVAINKIDLPSANPDRVKKMMAEHGLMSEDWGGKTLMIGVSAKTGKGIDELLEMLALESELLELRADPTAEASGVVIEAELSKGSGVLTNVLVQDGTLRVGDVVIVGEYCGKVRAMINDSGQRIKEALPSTPVEILGMSDVPRAGDRFYWVKDERKAREIIEKKQQELRDRGGVSTSHVTLEHLLDDIKAGKVEELKLIIKSDVQGSVEALRSTLAKIPAKNARLNIIHVGVGDVTESDVMLGAASNAVVMGFHVGMSVAAREIADREQVDVRFYEIIYEAKTAIEKAMEGLLEPESKEVFVGIAEVRQVFKVSKVGTIAGCTVQKGKIVRNFTCRVIRNGQKIHEGKVESLKRFKDDAREVLEGFECGIGVSNFDDLIAADRIEVFEIQKKARKLE